MNRGIEEKDYPAFPYFREQDPDLPLGIIANIMRKFDIVYIEYAENRQKYFRLYNQILERKNNEKK